MIIVRRLWRKASSGFWLLSGAVACAYAALAFVLLEVDRAVGDSTTGFAFGGDAGAARELLSVVAGSLITVAGLAFSLTIVVLTLVSNQFTPRALPGFLADRLNQVVAGSFVGVFAYCLLVLRSVRGEGADSGEFVPGISIAVGILLALASLALLLAFIDHMGRAIQASEIAARIGRATREAVERLYPDPYQGSDDEAVGFLLREWQRHTPSATVGAARAGYVTDVSLEQLLDVLDRREVRLHVPVMPGEFVTAATTVVSVWTSEPVTPEARASLGAAISVANERHLALDAGYGARQLADVVLRALSPGTNDPTTAETCIGYLRDILELLAGRAMPAEVLRLEPRRVTVVRRRRSFEDWLDASFGEIARFAAANTRIVASVLTALEGVANEALRVGAEDRLRAATAIADHVAAAALEAATSDRDRRIVARHRDAILAIAALRGVR